MKCLERNDMQNLDESRIKRITASAKRRAAKEGFAQDGEDFAQEALIRIMHGRKTYLDCLLIDYLRKNYSNPRAKSANLKYNEKVSYVEINEEICGMENHTDTVDFSIFQDQLDSKARAIMTLRYKWGFTESEIGECFGVSEGRISQKLTEIKTELAKLVRKESLK